jgi:hypothetical protein
VYLSRVSYVPDIFIWCAGVPKGSADALMVQLQEIQAQVESLQAEAEQHRMSALAFDKPEPRFLQLGDMHVRKTPSVEAVCQHHMIFMSYVYDV